MSSNPTLPASWPAFLSELDKRLSAPVELHCLGGFVLAVLYGVPRPTGDLDFIAAVPRDAAAAVELLAGRDSKLALKHKVYAQQVGVTDLPESYTERLVDLNLGLHNLNLKVLEVYDLVLSKLTRNSPKDREDVKYLATKLRLSFRTTMERFAIEMKPWIPNLDRHELTLKLWQEYFSE